MKAILSSSAILLVIIVGSLSMNNYLGHTATELCAQLERVQQLVASEQWSAANSLFTEADQRWHEVSDVWAAIIRHQEIDQLEESFARIGQLLAAADQSEALAELEVAKLLLQHVPAKEQPRLQNIM